MFEALKGRDNPSQECFALSGLQASSTHSVLGRRHAVPQADMWLPLRGEENLGRIRMGGNPLFYPVFDGRGEWREDHGLR